MRHSQIYTSRRDLLTGGLTLLSTAATLPAFLGGAIRALAQDSRPARHNDSERILVVVQLAGGNDGLNTIVPLGNAAYRKARPRLAIHDRDALKLEGDVGLHPAAVGLKELFDQQRLAIVQAVGYPNPNRSHFTSMDIWHCADPNLRKHDGWLGRYFDNCCPGADPDPIAGVALMPEAPLAMQGERFAPLAFENPEALRWRFAADDPRAEAAFQKLNNTDGDLPTGGSRLADYLQRAALDALLGAEDIRNAAGGTTRRPARRGGGGELAASLDLVVKMITADLPTRIYYVSMGGFDTHSGQEGRHRTLMTQLGNALKDFLDDLEQHKLLDRVLVLTFSEFGRRVRENASGGTDHGEAAPMFLAGSKVRGGVHGDLPSLDNLHRGDLPFQTDFRRVYATVLKDWLKVKPEAALGGNFQPLKLLRA